MATKDALCAEYDHEMATTRRLPFVVYHLVHHCGPLSVYLRVNHVPVPAIYGPSADEG